MDIFKIKTITAAAITVFAVSSNCAMATNLLEVWREAQNRDPEFIASRYEQMAKRKSYV